ncbi:MAG: hypothetical protein L6406_14415, partial [Desulfobacterales bacterium]|nr:hypothetical protein [Desulfobacterales bacterium]
GKKLYVMKLNGMADAFKDQLQQPNINDLPFEDRFALLVDLQWTFKEDRRMKRLLSNPDGHFKIPHLWPGQNTPATG